MRKSASWMVNHWKPRVNTIICLQSPSNQCFYTQITGYEMSVGDHRVAWWWRGVMGKQISYVTLIINWGVPDHASHTPHPNQCHIATMYIMLLGCFRFGCSALVNNSRTQHYTQATSLVALSVLDALSIACTHSSPCNTHSIQCIMISAYTVNMWMGFWPQQSLQTSNLHTYLTVAGTVE